MESWEFISYKQISLKEIELYQENRKKTNIFPTPKVEVK
jgi:hypothetical protein